MNSNKQEVGQGQSGSQKPTGWKAFFLRTYHPRPSVLSTIVLFIILGIIFLIFGIILFVLNNRIVEVQYNYTSSPLCDSSNPYCTVIQDFVVSEDMNPPVFVFYELHNFYQNHRRYIKSKSQTQLAGETITTSVAKTNCDPVVYNGNLTADQQLGYYFNNKQRDPSKKLNPEALAYPCGLIAKSFFTDQYKLIAPDNTEISIDYSDIAWPGDIGKKFKNQNDNTTQWIDVTDPHFVVWMRTAGLPDFRKLWGKINQKLPSGKYTLQIDNTYKVQGNFNGDKIFVLSTSGPFGGKNVFLATAYVVIGSICFVVAIIFFVKHRMNKNFGYDEKDK